MSIPDGRFYRNRSAPPASKSKSKIIRKKLFVNHPLHWRTQRRHGGKSTGEGMPRAPKHTPFCGISFRYSTVEGVSRMKSAGVRQTGVYSGARRTLPPSAWLRASPCPPAKRVVYLLRSEGVYSFHNPIHRLRLLDKG